MQCTYNQHITPPTLSRQASSNNHALATSVVEPSIKQDNESSAQKRRIEFIDLAKGICIMLVVMDHCGFYIHDIGSNLAHLRMPLYFFLSGIFFKDYGGIGKTILRKCDKLLIPFAFFFSVNILLAIILKMMTHSPLPDVSYFFINGRITILSLWFLLCLFWQSVLYSTVYRFTANIISLGIITLCLSALGITLSNYKIILPLYLDSALSFSPFFFMGFSMRKTDLLFPNKKDKYILPTVITSLILATAIGYANGLTDVKWVYNEYDGNILLHFAQSAVVVIAMILLCKLVNRLPVVSYIGRYSIIILVMHGIYLKVCSSIVTFANFELSSFCLTMIVFFLSLLSIEPLRRFFPYVTAQKNFLSVKF